MALSSESVAAWSGIELVERLAGGARNEVVLARRGGRRVVVRRSARSLAALEWELDLLNHLASHGIGVPRLVATDDGRRHVDGVQVHEFVDGRRPRDRPDRQR
ncbi:phosphotransferase [Couchioplanes azureus]|uniref:phosphotransferase n=1 Tax=Couchioplanes caeruleus TaxID=56438 RepID=UPI00166FCD76|nr:phosphotransferase [Couchioplanes caeruleus]